MPLADQFVEAAGAARNSRALDDIARLLWRAHGEGQIGDAEASAVSEAIEGRRRIFAAGQGFRPLSPKAVLSFPRGSPRSPDRQASLERRRRQAASGALPPAMACRFTVGEQAALAVVARQVQRHQVCVLCLDAVAAMAGVSRSTAKNAIREARRLGLLEVRERRRPGEKSLPNIVKVIDPALLGWLRLRADRVGVKNLTPTDTAYLSRGKTQDSRHSLNVAAGSNPASFRLASRSKLPDQLYRPGRG